MRTFDNNKMYRLYNGNNIRVIFGFSDNSLIRFNRGNKDDYQVTYIPDRYNNLGYSPVDSDYFQDLLELSHIFGKDKVYHDFLKIAELVKLNGIRHNGKPEYGEVEKEEVIDQIRSIRDSYELSQEDLMYLEIPKLFCLLWTLMISEWYYGSNIGFTSRTKHLVKLIGVYQSIYELCTPREAQEFSIGMKPRQQIEYANENGIDTSWLAQYECK